MSKGGNAESFSWDVLKAIVIDRGYEPSKFVEQDLSKVNFESSPEPALSREEAACVVILNHKHLSEINPHG